MNRFLSYQFTDSDFMSKCHCLVYNLHNQTQCVPLREQNETKYDEGIYFFSFPLLYCYALLFLNLSVMKCEIRLVWLYLLGISKLCDIGTTS